MQNMSPQCEKTFDTDGHEYCPFCSWGYSDYDEDDDDTSIIFVCPQCGAETTDEDEIFCPECGYRWDEDFDSDFEEYNNDGATPLHW